MKNAWQFPRNSSPIFLAVALCVIATTASGKDKPLERIAFGSCALQSEPQPIWKEVRESRPDVFLLIGDNIYGDTDDMKVMREKYAQLDAQPEFAKLRKKVPFLATWDDHDYGRNNAGEEYPFRKESQQVFLDFMRAPKDSPRRTQEGVYSANIFGPVGKRVQIFLLDTRYFRSPLLEDTSPNRRNPYIGSTNADATILGETQWRWFEEQLRQPAEVRLVVSSIQVISPNHGGEKWMNFPLERERLFKLIRDTKAEGVIFLSGDRHFAELSVIDGGVGYPLYDFTSSGLNRGRDWRYPESNPHRVQMMHYGDNFGLIEIDWKNAPRVSLQIRDVKGDVITQQKFPLKLLHRPTAKQ